MHKHTDRAEKMRRILVPFTLFSGPGFRRSIRLLPLAGLLLALSGCQRPSIVETDPRNYVAPVETGIPLELVDASFFVDGALRSDRINLSTTRFVFLFVFIKSKGLYIVSAAETPGATVSGKFMGSHLAFIAGGTRIQFDNTTGHLLGDQNDRDAWVEYLPNYDLLGPDASPDEAVIGLARSKQTIPGFARNN